MLFAIDPGTESSALVVMDTCGAVASAHHFANADLVALLRQTDASANNLAVEMFASYGMAVGSECFETVLWTGRFVEAWCGEFSLVYRREVKLALCNSPRANDANIRAALVDLYGGSIKRAKGTKAAPGPLYGVSKHLWAALGVGVAWHVARDPAWLPSV